MSLQGSERSKNLPAQHEATSVAKRGGGDAELNHGIRCFTMGAPKIQIAWIS